MMTNDEHRREAEAWLDAAWKDGQTERADMIATAHVHALLALNPQGQAVPVGTAGTAYTCAKCGRNVVTRTDHAEDCPIRNQHPAELMPAPKGYMCAAGCGHSINVHREHGCDHLGCDCHAPYGRVMPGDPDPTA